MLNCYYENAAPGYLGTEYVMSAEQQPCWHCEQATDRIEICFEAPLCSVACLKAKSDEYWEALGA